MTATTDQSGLARFSVRVPDYGFLIRFTADKGDAKNVIDGNVIVKIFESQDEIAASPAKSPAPTIGSPKFQDTNDDRLINEYDRTYADLIIVEENKPASKTAIIFK